MTKYPTSFILAIVVLLQLCSCQNAGEINDEPINFQFEEMTVAEMQKGFSEGRFTIRDVVSAYLKRIEEIDQNGPSLNSILEINPDALAIAEALDEELKNGNRRSALHGIPIILKDNIDTHDKMMTTAGSRALKGSIAPQDSWVAAKLRESGAVIIAKANLSEWANFRSNKSSSGWSGMGGQTLNPYDVTRNPCGSSAGSGVAVSANLCMIAIGTETNGSIVCPSNANGIVGIKPTVGLIGRSGIIPISDSQDTAGPMARTVSDATACLGLMTGTDERDPKTNLSKGKAHTDYTSFLKKDGLKGKRLAYFTKAKGFHREVDSLTAKAIRLMEEQGAEVIEIETISPVEVGGASFEVLLYEFKDGLNKYLASLGENAPVKNLEELIAFNDSDEIESKFDQDLLKMAASKGSLNDQVYLEALAKMHKNMRELGIDKVMAEHKLDAIIAPTGSPAWKTDHINGDHYLGGSSSPAAIAGYPNINVPMGMVEGLPVGISFFGRAWSEPVLIEISYAYEQASKHRVAPTF